MSARSRNDAKLWADLLGEFRSAGADSDAAEIHARRAVAFVRRERSATTARTFAPGDEIPIDVMRAYDLDGDIWERQSGDPADSLRDSWKMPGFDPDQHEGACAGVWITPWLLDRYGPMTEIRPHGKMRTGTREPPAPDAEPPMETPKQVADELFRRAFGHGP